MTERGKVLLGGLRKNFELLQEHDKISPDDVNEILAVMVGHIRNWKPDSLFALSNETGPVGKVDL